MRARCVSSWNLWVGIALVTAGCGSNFGTRDNPELSLCLGPAGVSCTRVQTGTVLTPIEASRIPGQDSFYDMIVENLGEAETRLLNVYLAQGSNQYLTLEWPQSDPSGEGLYQSGDVVASCSPDRSTVGDPATLPDAVGAESPCVFPLPLSGVNENGAPGQLRLRLRYSYEPTQVPDNNPARVVFHFEYKEDDLALDGVRIVEVPVEACTGIIEVSPAKVTFGAAPPNVETQSICLANNGCAELELLNVSFANPVAGDVFTFLNVPPPGTKIPPVSTDPDNPAEPICFVVRFAPADTSKVSNVVQIETNDPINPRSDVLLESGEGCPYSYELQHTDQVESGKEYIDFSGVVAPATAEKTITLRNTNTCPITLQSLEIPPKDLKTQGGPYWAEIRKQGATVGYVGVPATPGVTLNPKVVLQNQDDALDIILHFEPDENVTYGPSTIALNLRTGNSVDFKESILVQAGEPTAELALAPLAGSPVLSALYFAANQGETASRTFALHNLGLAGLQVTGLKLKGSGAADYSLIDDGVHVSNGQFVPSTLGGLGVIAVEVEFSPTTGAFDSDAEIEVYTEEYPENGAEDTPYVVILQGFGYYPPSTVPELPVASFGLPEQFADIHVGDVVSLSGASSTGGSTTLNASSYAFWLSAKPDGSAAYVNSQGKVTSNFKADRAGTYRVHLTVFGQEQGTGNYLYSLEATLDIEVTE